MGTVPTDSADGELGGRTASWLPCRAALRRPRGPAISSVSPSAGHSQFKGVTHTGTSTQGHAVFWLEAQTHVPARAWTPGTSLRPPPLTREPCPLSSQAGPWSAEPGVRAQALPSPTWHMPCREAGHGPEGHR